MNVANFTYAFGLQFSQWEEGYDGWSRQLCLMLLMRQIIGKIKYFVGHKRLALCSCSTRSLNIGSVRSDRTNFRVRVTISMRSWHFVMTVWLWTQKKKYLKIWNEITYSIRIRGADAAARWHFPKSINLPESPFINAIIYLIRNKHSILWATWEHIFGFPCSPSLAHHLFPLVFFYLGAFNRIMCCVPVAPRTKVNLEKRGARAWTFLWTVDTVSRGKFIVLNNVTCNALKVRRRMKISFLLDSGTHTFAANLDAVHIALGTRSLSFHFYQINKFIIY